MKLPKIDLWSLQDRKVYIAASSETGETKITECRFASHGQREFYEIGWDIPTDGSECECFWGPMPDFELEGK